MTHTAKASVVASRIKTILDGLIGSTAFFNPPIAGVSYGDQIKVPDTPWVCVDPGTASREWPPTPTMMAQNTLEVHVFIYHSRIDENEGNEVVKLESDQLAEALAEFLNTQHFQLADAGGSPLVIFGCVIEHEPGYVMRKKANNTTLFNASRLLWRAVTKTQITAVE